MADGECSSQIEEHRIQTSVTVVHRHPIPCTDTLEYCLQANAATNNDLFSRNPAGVVRGKEQSGVGNVVDRAYPHQRSSRSLRTGCEPQISENRQVELSKARRRGDDVGLNNLSVGDREAEYSRQLAIWREYNSHRPVNQGRLCEPDHLRGGDRALCPVPRAPDFSRSSWTRSRLVDARQHVGIEHRDKRFEVPAPQSCEKRVDHPSLVRKISARVRFLGLNFFTVNPSSRAAGKLPRRFRRSIKDRSNLVERDREYIV